MGAKGTQAFFVCPNNASSGEEGVNMKIKYEFADGTVQEIEVDESFGNYYIQAKREEENLNRKERYHNTCSLDSMDYEGDFFADETYSPETLMNSKESQKRVDEFLSSLTDIQRKRVEKLLDGKSMRQIAKEEGVDISTVTESLKSVRKKYLKFF